MSEIFNNESDLQFIKNNIIVASDVKFKNTKIEFFGVDNYIYIESGSKFEDVKIDVKGNSNFIYIGCSSAISLRLSVFYNSIIYIGPNNYFNGPLSILCAEERIVFIGSNNLFSTNVSLRTSDAHLIYSCNSNLRINRADDIFIGNHVWICDDVKVSKGAEVYSNVVIGTKSFISNTICYSNCIYAGSPVRLVKSNIDWRGNCTYAYQNDDYEKWNIIRNLNTNHEGNTNFNFIKIQFNTLKSNFVKLLEFIQSDVFLSCINNLYNLYNLNNSFSLCNKKRIYSLISNKWNDLFKKNFVNTTPLKADTVFNGYILPTVCVDRAQGHYSGGVVDDNENFITGFKRHRSRLGFYSCESMYSFDSNTVQTSSEIVIFGGILINHFGHFILEGFSRLWYLIIHPQIMYQYKIVFCTINGVSDWFFSFFEMFGLHKERIIFIDHITRFSKIIIPEQSILSWDYVHLEYFLPYDCILNYSYKKCKNLNNFDKLYLSKVKSNSGCRCIGEEYFEDFYVRKGFKVIYTEKLSVLEQVYLVSTANEIVTTLGTLSHFFLFVKDSCRVITLTRTHDDTLYPQALINKVRNLDYYIVDVSLNIFYAVRYTGISLLGITKSWKDFVKDQYNEIIDYETDSKYIVEYYKAFYQMYKSPSMFKKILQKGMVDVFKRLGILFCDEQFNYLEQQEINFEQSAEYYRYQVSLLKSNPMLCDHIDDRVFIKYSGHICGVGDSQFVFEDSVLGFPEKKQQIEGLTIDFINKNNRSKLKMKYSVLCNNEWQNFVGTGLFCGTKGKSISISGIVLCLFTDEKESPQTFNVTDGSLSYDLEYRIFDSTKKWSEWVHNGEKLISSEKSKIYAIQIHLVSKVI